VVGVVVLLGEAHRLPVMQGFEEVSPSYVTPYYTSPLPTRCSPHDTLTH